MIHLKVIIHQIYKHKGFKLNYYKNYFNIFKTILKK